MPVAAVIICLV